MLGHVQYLIVLVFQADEDTGCHSEESVGDVGKGICVMRPMFGIFGDQVRVCKWESFIEHSSRGNGGRGDMLASSMFVRGVG